MPGRVRARVGAVCVAITIVLPGASVPAAAASKPITGKLSKPGYTVIALAANGKARSVVAKLGKFRLRPPAKVVTLHLRAKDGTYAGPIVVDREGRRAILGVKSGAELGRISVRNGYAKVTKTLPEEWIDRGRWARARNGVPIGARVFGRVRSKPTGGGVPGDRDVDGIPEPLDIDDDGDRILDNLDKGQAKSSAWAAQTDGCGPGGFYCPTISSYLPLANFEQTVNVNAGSTAAEIDAALSSVANLRFSPLSDSVELDCGGEPDPDNPDGWIGGLRYCTRGGTGTLFQPGPDPPPFPECCDPDDDGFGTFPKPSFLAHRATTAEIKTGDILTQRVTNDGTETLVPTTLNFVFVTVPALVSYSDTAGNSATVSYPVAPGGPGTFGNGFPVSAPAGQDVVVTLTFWRPQRQAIPDSDPLGAQWMDIGHLRYAVGGCSQGTLSSTDPHLAPPSLPLLGMGSLEDLSDDQESSPGKTFTYALNLSQCLAEHGISFNSGDEQPIAFSGVAGATDAAHQTVSFKRQ